jgi:hypothetical protein
MKNEPIKNVTTWGLREELIESEYGTITYREWCQEEVARMNRNGGSVVALQRGDECCVAQKKILSKRTCGVEATQYIPLGLNSPR